MRLRLSVTLDITRTPKPEHEVEHEHRDNDGTLSESIGHPRYTGFTPEGEPRDRMRP